ncbi:hypothetical protein COCON_G00016500 [Conger conger]|uniref:Mitochondrial ribonuclease P catalytic subunit n=1 Tax=Conger conger TaxID=82655 RepID=A0A9Q1I9M6_CONCO|nr:hypothetical protein COCON_G00016500 [Conger conger]
MGPSIYPYLSLHLKYTFPLIISRPLFSVNKSYSFLFKRVMLPNVHYFSTKDWNEVYANYKKANRESKQKNDNDEKIAVFARSVFAAGTAKRKNEIFRSKSANEAQEHQENYRRGRGFKLPDHPLTTAEWKNLKENAENSRRFEIRVMNKMLCERADINVAKSFLAYVALETGTVSYELLLKYLALCVYANRHSEVFDVYDIMKSRFKAFDNAANGLFMRGFCMTERWKEALPILETIKKLSVPSPRNYADVIDGAVRHGDIATAWALYNEILDTGIIPKQQTWQSLFESGLSDPSTVERLESILYYMRDNQIYPNESVAQSIKAWFERLPGDKWKGRWSTGEPSAVCESCQVKLESLQLTEEEYRQLKDHVMTDVIEGQDIFSKTTPEELELFKAFVKQNPAFDVVIDGLNVANTTIRGKQSQMLLEVVSQLKKQGWRVLVLGRKHMLQQSCKWDQRHMSLIQRRAHCFFTDNLTEDDPFILYAALHSGNHCVFVSQDLMRDHKACMPNSAMKRLFFKWQRGHQLVLNTWILKKVHFQFQTIQDYDTIVQTDKTSWHIPYDADGVDRCTFEVPQKWLCLTRK